MDPPYLETTSYRMGFRKQDHVDLAGMLRELKAKWVLTINDHPLIKKLYKGFNTCSHLTSLSAQKVEKNQPRKQLNNLVITNYKM